MLLLKTQGWLFHWLPLQQSLCEKQKLHPIPFFFFQPDDWFLSHVQTARPRERFHFGSVSRCQVDPLIFNWLQRPLWPCHVRSGISLSFFLSTSLWWTTVVFLLQTLSIESNPRLGRIGYGLRSNFYKWDIDFFFLFLIRGFYYIRADHGFEYLTSICSDFRSKINPGWLAGTFETGIFGWNSCRKM